MKKKIPSGPKGKGITKLKKVAPAVAAKMGYKNGGCVMAGRGGKYKGEM